MKTLILAIAAFLGFNLASFAGVDINCVPTQEMKEPLRVGWDSLLSVKSFSMHMELTNPNATAKLVGTANDEFNKIDKELTQEFTPERSSGQVLDLQSVHSAFYLQFEKVLFSITNIDSPPTAGPMPEGKFPATAALVFVSQYRTNAGPNGKSGIATLNMPLDCSYEVKYRNSSAQ